MNRALSVLIFLSLAACGGDSGTYPSGDGALVSTDLVVGTGATAVAGDTVTVHYIGTFTNGTKFDSSYDRNQPFSFRIGAGQVIAGWEQGVPGMKVGSKRRLTVPPSLASGNQAVGPIPANSTLIFEIELLSIAGQKGKGEGAAPYKECPECECACGTMTRIYPQCGFEFPPPERVVDTAPAHKPIHSVESEWLDVSDVAYPRHEKAGSPPSLRIRMPRSMPRSSPSPICTPTGTVSQGT